MYNSTGLLIAIEVLAVMFGGWTGLEGSVDWGKVPDTVPVMIFSLVYHDLTPRIDNCLPNYETKFKFMY